MPSRSTPTDKSPGEGQQAARVKWDDSNMRTSYANVCNVSSTREEVVMFFGISQASQGGEPEVRVQLSDRLILSPFAAKRLAGLLSSVISQYEARFGSLEAAAPGLSAKPGSG